MSSATTETTRRTATEAEGGDATKPAAALSLPGPAPAHPSPWLAVMTLARREIVRFLRQKHRVFGAVGQPALFWLLFGTGFDASFQNPYVASDGFSQYFFPGTLVLITLFTSIFTTFSIISDRNEGFLQGVLVAPAPRWAMVFGKVLGGTVLATLQAGLFLLAAPLIGIKVGVAGMLAALAALALISFALTAMGFCLAWRMDSIQGFHAIMMVFLLPMWLLSGAFFPAAGANPVLAWIIRLNPLTYGVAAVRRLLTSAATAPGSGVMPAAELPALGLSLAIVLGFGVLMMALATRIAARPLEGVKG